MDKRSKRRLKLAIWGVVAGMVVALVWPYAQFALALWRNGFFDSTQVHKYQGTNLDNLKKLRIALMHVHENDGQFPDSAKWMDAIRNVLKTADLTQEEAEKKMVNPLIPPTAPGIYGYAMNDAASKKYKGDLDPKTILVFDSRDTSWDAHGDPTKLKPKDRARGHSGITVDGTIVELK